MMRESLSDFYEHSTRGAQRHNRLKKTLAGFSMVASLISLSACSQEAQGPAAKAPTGISQPQKLTTAPELNVPSSTAGSVASVSATAASQELTSPPATIEATATTYDLEAYYGQDCQAIVETKPTNLISMDYLHDDELESVDNGLGSYGLKRGLTDRVSQVLTQSHKDYHIKLSDQQQAVLQASVDQLVEATYGGDILPNDTSYFITVASFRGDDNHLAEPPRQIYDSGKRLGNQPIYLQPELNYCVFDLDEAQIQ